jgi:hypothetical protein
MADDTVQDIGVSGESTVTDKWRVWGGFINRGLGMIPLYNRSGGAVTTGMVVVQDTSIANSFTTTTTSRDLRPVFVVPYNLAHTTGAQGGKTIADDELGYVFGPGAGIVEVDVYQGSAVSIGEYLITHNTAGFATNSGVIAAAGTPPPPGAFAIALTSKAAESGAPVQAIMLGHTIEGIGGRAVATTAPTDRQVLGWDAANSRWSPFSTFQAGTAISISNTSTETTVLSKSIAAASMGVNGAYRIRARFDLTNAMAAAKYLTIRYKLGGTTIFVVTVGNSGASAVPFFISHDFLITNLGSASSQIAQLAHRQAGDYTNGQSQTVGVVVDTDLLYQNTAAENTANALTAAVTIQLDDASASLSAKGYAILEGPIYSGA